MGEEESCILDFNIDLTCIMGFRNVILIEPNYLIIRLSLEPEEL